MTTRDAIALLLPRLEGYAVICANGYISRWACALGDRPRHFYMIGSMGLASSIGLGVALALPAQPVAILDGDGNVLMGLSSLAMIGAVKPERLVHVVLDNGVYASTGSQPTISKRVALEDVAAAAGYARAVRVREPEALVGALREQLATPGPSFLVVETSGDAGAPAPRIPFSPHEMTTRMRAALGRGVDPSRTVGLP